MEGYERDAEDIINRSRTLHRNTLILHDIQLKRMSLPYVEMELNTHNCSGFFCRKALHLIAHKQRTYATTHKVSLQTLGPISTEDTLLEPQFKVEAVLNNMQHVNSILKTHFNIDMELLLKLPRRHSTENELLKQTEVDDELHSSFDVQNLKS